MKNQMNPPLKKEKRTDNKGNSTKRIAVRTGNSTTIFAKGLTENACKILRQKTIDNVKDLGGEVVSEIVYFT